MIPDIAYKPGWRFKVGGPAGRFLCVFATTPDSSDPRRLRTTQHMRQLPASGEDFSDWLWRFILDVERHEAGEFLRIDGERPFFPGHGDDDPYATAPR